MFIHINKNISSIQETILKRHPARKLPLEACFRAHNNKDYYLSIPAIFTQCDGISKDKTGFSFFKNKSESGNRIPKTESWVNQSIAINLHKALASALTKKGAFQLHFSEKNKIDITRHSVLHGESIDYGTEINSLKAISLMIYLSDITNIE
jgi:hypothetical protein